MPGLALRTALTLAPLGIASATALDVAIDRTRHDHDSWAYRHGLVPTYALGIGGGVATAAGLGALAVPALRGAAPTLLKVGAGTLGAWAATMAVRTSIGMLFDPQGTGMRWNPGDLARNSIDRTHMMGDGTPPHERLILGTISELQGHGTYEERLARGDFEPVWPT